MKTMSHAARAAVPVIAIHGGAGTLMRSHISPAQESAYHAALQDVLRASQAVLAGGGTALDAVCVAVQALEDCPLFNAGHGAVFTADATHELDAAVMDGATLAGRCELTKGEPGNPHKEEELEEKFFSLGRPVWGEAVARKLYDACLDLESIDDFGEFSASLTL